MHCNFNVFYLICALMVLRQVALADNKGDRNGEVPEEEAAGRPNIDASNGTSSTASGGRGDREGASPYSHEAMNNVDGDAASARAPTSAPRARRKRNYEFLMGLINKNSKYQVTKDESSINVDHRDKIPKETIASELLLELMVKIASNPHQWNKVHQLLTEMDKDILSSKQLMEGMRKLKNEKDLLVSKKDNITEKPKNSDNNIPKANNKTKIYENNIKTDLNKEVAMDSDNGFSNDASNLNLFPMLRSDMNVSKTVKPWPLFEESLISGEKLEKFKNDEDAVTKYPWRKDLSVKGTYPKNFAYHRVTGKPPYVNQTPKAYIAVSVVAPKVTSPVEDLALEKQLRQLKPWTHWRNLKNMENLRSSWFIENSNKNKKMIYYR